MALTYTPMTELEAVNAMLASIGEQPVNTIPSSGVSEASLAQTTLHNTSRDVQKKGLHCNTDYKHPMVPNGSSNIIRPTNALRFDPYYQYQNYTERQGKLYDIEDRTFTFTDTIYMEIVWFYKFEELPEHVRSYIFIKAARRFQTNTVGSQKLHEFTAQDEYEAKAEMERIEFKNQCHTMLNGAGVNHITNRRA
jgi:hypothetical protein